MIVEKLISYTPDLKLNPIFESDSKNVHFSLNLYWLNNLLVSFPEHKSKYYLSRMVPVALLKSSSENSPINVGKNVLCKQILKPHIDILPNLKRTIIDKTRTIMSLNFI